MAISPNVLAGLAAALGGGMKAFNTQRDADEQTRQFNVEEDRQQKLLARMISRDELDEFKTQEDIYDKKFDQAMTTAQQFGGQRLPESAVAGLPQNLQSLISRPAMTLESRQISGNLGTPGTNDAGDIKFTQRDPSRVAGQIDINMPESERARSAASKDAAAYQRALLLGGDRNAKREQDQNQFNAKLAQDLQLGLGRIAATNAATAQRGQGGGRGSTKIVTGTDGEGRPVSFLVDSDTGDIIRSYDKPLTTQERTAQTNSKASVDTINDIARLYKKDYVGPVQGRASSLSTQYGIDTPMSSNTPELAEFSAAVARYKNKMINKITGAAVGVQEEKRIMGEIPDLTDPSTTFEAKLKMSQENEKLLDTIIQRRGAVRPGASPTVPSAPSSPAAPPAGGKKKFEILSVK